MRISFHGAAQTVTGSQHLIEVNGGKLLLECGLFQGRRKEFYQRNSHFAFDPGELDAVILSHAHIDHSGNLPHLVKDGYNGPIYTTPATAHLANIMLMDSGHIQESDVKYVNRRRAKKGQPPVEPLYTMEGLNGENVDLYSDEEKEAHKALLAKSADERTDCYG